ncbi:C-type lectin domain family 12 member B isoform X2 [Suncus etruscus]|uniref:C-type lectin domain family 12 member B isoform X2 n=1 Tax=Suncus etruscus TaxID=109475 RepID=UPI002110DFA2|nr:C-type lectin domain family 12 member B isoform X2 [Suncus etruscus]
MSEEVTYATLRFQNSAGARNFQDRNNLRRKGYQIPSPIWRQAALGLLVLCLILVMGLVTLGIMFLQTESKINSDLEKLSQLPQVINHHQDISSQMPNNSSDLLNEEKSLKAQISSLLKRQGKMAIKLCQEFITHISDHKCNPCPKTWYWYQDSCYSFIANEEKTWNNSRRDCVEKNSTLVKIDSWKEKEFLKSQTLPQYSFFWLGLSWDPFNRSWLWEDGSIPFPSFAEIFWICEKAAALVKPEDLD